jgi:predicted nucleic acid-binding protein
MFLLDTNVVSELRKKATGRADGNVVAWEESWPASLMHLSVISLAEILTGVALKARTDPQAGRVLAAWADRLPAVFGDRLLGIDVDVARACGPLHVPDPVGDGDAWIAATAAVHGLRVVTRNTRHFDRLGVDVVNPWEPVEDVPLPAPSG